MVNTAVSPAVVLGAVRTYSHGGTGAAIAVRSTLPGGGTHYLFNDPHGTANLAMDTTTQQLSRQQYKPYGEARTNANPTAWPDLTHGYLGAPKDTHTGYTDVGARKYDPALGRFISADPLLQTTDPSQLGGYTYAGDNPITGADPSGLGRIDGDQSGCAAGNGGTCGGYIAPTRSTRANHNPVRVDRDGYGNYAVGNVPLTDDQVEDRDKFEHQVQEAYFELLAQGGDKWKALDDDTKLLQIMNRACQRIKNACRSPFAAELARQNAIRGVYNSGCHDECLRKYLASVGVVEAVVTGGIGYFGGWFQQKAGRAATSVSYNGISAMGQGASVGCVDGNSFTPETLVKMDNGSTKPISDVRVGDKVLAIDPTDPTAQASSQEVTELHINTDTELVDLTVKTTDGNTATLHTTQHHPFWSSQRHQWIDAGDLQPGEALLAAESRASAPDPQPTVALVRSFPGRQTMYNLTVRHIHTYYVMAGNTPVLVHNVGPACEISVSRTKYPESAEHIEDAQAAGQPTELTIDRAGAAARRRASMRGNPRVSGKDRDEYPPAMFEEGGSGSSVRPIDPSDNRGRVLDRSAMSRTSRQDSCETNGV
ncbi:polymorphic toxin-type HINT domain-containing protein [Krasilnikovia cinnamomea]|uniref:polymorphic toxin-type HINT domain-containing protein n=1 Tax=Krasilnikovia cinnamomea TaxID=349313 RepID=UPI00102C8A3F|nr:polymorphic toxin-type HINT domain-containing protein [Krasilnikovia cinnamomea]